MEGVSVKEMENEERKQEDVMKRFRSRDCNILVATSVLEDGIDVPACHLVIRYDLPQSYRAYVHSKARARAKKAHYILMVENERMDDFLVDLSHFHATEQILLSKSGYHNSVAEFFNHNENMLNCIQAPYSSSETSKSYASLQNAISIINRYPVITHCNIIMLYYV
jgi:endoribonuclease Dicer